MILVRARGHYLCLVLPPPPTPSEERGVVGGRKTNVEQKKKKSMRLSGQLYAPNGVVRQIFISLVDLL